MKVFPWSIRLFAVGSLVGALHAEDPVLSTPGTATWMTDMTSTGTRTVFTLTKNTVLNWAQLDVKSGSELVFNFEGGKSVVNFLGGSGVHVIDGTVTSNGIVAFFSPTADLEVNGSIIAKGVTLSTLNTDSTEFFQEKGYRMSGLDGLNFLTVNGHVEAVGGDVVIGGERVIIGDTAKIRASKDVLIGGGADISVAGSGERRLKDNSGVGYVLHLGETGASRIEVVAGMEVSNQGRLDAGKGRIFLEVGSDGLITNESSGVIVGNAVFTGAYDANGVVVVPDEGDSIPVVSEGLMTIPELRRPDGSAVNGEQRTLTNSVPMSASEDAGRKALRGDQPDKRLAQKSGAKSMLQRSSFFGMRGGNAGPAKR